MEVEGEMLSARSAELDFLFERRVRIESWILGGMVRAVSDQAQRLRVMDSSQWCRT